LVSSVLTIVWIARGGGQRQQGPGEGLGRIHSLALRVVVPIVARLHCGNQSGTTNPSSRVRTPWPPCRRASVGSS
jgi:hypothetical protein